MRTELRPLNRGMHFIGEPKRFKGPLSCLFRMLLSSCARQSHQKLDAVCWREIDGYRVRVAKNIFDQEIVLAAALLHLFRGCLIGYCSPFCHLAKRSASSEEKP